MSDFTKKVSALEKKFLEKYRSELFITAFWLFAGAVLAGCGYLAFQANLTSMIMSFVGGA